MTRRLMPPAHALRAFVATARLGSVSAAARALHLTQGAVSKQVRELESWVGVQLFDRVRQRMVLTPAGARYEAAVRPLLTALEEATLELISHQHGGGALHLSTLPTIGAKWLIPRLPAFQRLHPQVTIHFVPYVQGYDFSRPDLDAAIRYGDGAWPGAQSDYLVGREMVVIAPPGTGSSLRKPAQVSRHVLLHHASVPNAWAQWCETHEVTSTDPHAGPHLDQFQSLVRAVAAGMGLALVPRCLVDDDVASGVVDCPWDEGYTACSGYHLCYPQAKRALGPLASFREWALACARENPRS